jgi:hypothetical protein
MTVLNRLQLMKIHAILAALILPVASMFFITGALYTWDVKGSYSSKSYDIPIHKPLQPQLSELVLLAETELERRKLPTPTGPAKIKHMGNAFKFEWSGSRLDISIESGSKPLVAKLEIKETNWYRQFVQLHKAKGGDAFKVYAVFMAVSMLCILITGFTMAWQSPKLRKLSLGSAIIGVALFVGMVIAS